MPRLDSITARFPRNELDAALDILERDDDDSALKALVLNTAYEDQRERLETAWFSPMRRRNTGSAPQPRDENGLTPKRAASVKGYAVFHAGLKAGLTYASADAKAVNGNRIFATVAQERRKAIYSNEDGETNKITKRPGGPYVVGAAKIVQASLFIGHEKVEAKKLPP